MVRRKTIVVSVILMSFLTSTVWAQAGRMKLSCLQERLPSMSSDKSITLYLSDGTKIRGKLVSFEPERLRLSIHERYRRDRGFTTYSFDEISKVSFRTAGHVQPKWMAMGFFGGMLVGAALWGAASTGGDDPDGGFCGVTIDESIVGFAVTFGLGVLVLAAGTLIPLFTSSEKVECPPSEH